MLRKGNLFYDWYGKCIDVVFEYEEFYDDEVHVFGGLRRGQPLELLTDEGWKPTRIEYDPRYDDLSQEYYGDGGWYLVGFEEFRELAGLYVRIEA